MLKGVYRVRLTWQTESGRWVYQDINIVADSIQHSIAIGEKWFKSGVDVTKTELIAVIDNK